MTSDAADALARRAVGERFGVAPGASSFFAHPAARLDPALMDGEHLRPEVRNWIRQTLYGFWASRYHAVEHWHTIWIAGSGITYQWDAARSVGEPGDLDVLIGVDFPKFFAANARWRGTPETDMAEAFNDEFRGDLDRRTARQDINGTTYEVTWYVNPNSTDIRTIHPYAAYDVTHDVWTVRPPALPADWDPTRELPSEWFDQFAREAEQAKHITTHATMLATAFGMAGNEGLRRNLAVQLHHEVQMGATLFDSIHGDRHQAFGPGGEGYADYWNVRWQAHKRDGSVAALHQLKDLWTAAHQDITEACSPGGIPDAQHALRLATMVTQRR